MLTWAPFKRSMHNNQHSPSWMSPMASTGKDPLQPHWDDEPFPPDQVMKSIFQLWHNNQNAKMVIILFGEHSIIGDYAKAIKADDDSVDISFGAMTIR